MQIYLWKICVIGSEGILTILCKPTTEKESKNKSITSLDWIKNSCQLLEWELNKNS